MRLVILESPFAGKDDAETQVNIEYARKAVRDSLSRNEAPIASHLLYTQPGILRDDVPHERTQGIAAGLAWHRAAQGTVVYMDHGISKGMQHGITVARAHGTPVEFREIGAQV